MESVPFCEWENLVDAYCDMVKRFVTTKDENVRLKIENKKLKEAFECDCTRYNNHMNIIREELKNEKSKLV